MKKNPVSDASETMKPARIRTKVRAGAGSYLPDPAPDGGGNGSDGGCPLHA